MNLFEKMLGLFQFICRFNFGFFEREEFKKFLRMGIIFAVIIGAYWTLSPLKDALFMQLVDKLQIPYAKTVSVLVLLPLVMIYTRLLEKTSKKKMFVILPLFYGCLVTCLGLLMQIFEGPPEEIAARPFPFWVATKVVGYLLYVTIESFGSLTVALFWAFSTSVTKIESAKRGFPLVVALGQMGGVILPFGVGGLPFRLGLQTNTLSIVILGLLILLITPLVSHLLRTTPKSLMVSFHGKNERTEEHKQKAGFLEGLKLLLTHRYLLGIFAANFVFEIIVAIFDFNFKIEASAAYSGVALTHYLSVYGSSVNIAAILCLLLGVSNITRFLGIGVALALMPVIFAGALFGFLSLHSLGFLFALMAGSKAINYALNGPALKQLYIPTTPDVKFKAQAWIETFGSRTSKQTGSLVNMSLAPFQAAFGEVAGKAHYLLLSGLFCFPLIAFWFIVALYLGRTFRKAIKEEKVVC